MYFFSILYLVLFTLSNLKLLIEGNTIITSNKYNSKMQCKVTWFQQLDQGEYNQLGLSLAYNLQKCQCVSNALGLLRHLQSQHLMKSSITRTPCEKREEMKKNV